MLDMGFCPTPGILASCRAAEDPVLRATSRRDPGPTREMLTPVTINLERKSAPPSHHSGRLPSAGVKSARARTLQRNIISTLVFTRTKHRAKRLAAYLDARVVDCAIHATGVRASVPNARRFQVRPASSPVATDIVARGIDVVEIGHVVNSMCGRSRLVHPSGGRYRPREATGDAFTFVSHERAGGSTAIGVPWGSLPASHCRG